MTMQLEFLTLCLNTVSKEALPSALQADSNPDTAIENLRNTTTA